MKHSIGHAIVIAHEVTKLLLKLMTKRILHRSVVVLAAHVFDLAEAVAIW